MSSRRAATPTITTRDGFQSRTLPLDPGDADLAELAALVAPGRR